MKDVYEALHLADAHYVKGLLEAEGIAAGVRGGVHHATRGEVGGIPGMLPVVFVLEDGDFLRAAELLRDYPGDPSGPPWICPGCGEALEAQFSSCWKCGQPRPEA